MQEFHDNRMEEIKVLADFDLNLEAQLLRMSVDDFYFHVLIKHNHTDRG